MSNMDDMEYDSPYDDNTNYDKEDIDDDKELPKNAAIICSMQHDRFEVFKAQNEEKGHFDCVVEIDGKRILVHKYFLATVSETFNTMMSDRWNKNNDNVIKIENPEYTYECFYELLCFIYSGDCALTEENVFVLTDMAEFFDIDLLKQLCMKYLFNLNITLANIQYLMQFAYKYSLTSISFKLERFIRFNFVEIIGSHNFNEYSKFFIETLSNFPEARSVEEEFFDKIYEWAHCQALNNGTREDDINEFIKAELNVILSDFEFWHLSFVFVKESIFAKRFLFSTRKLYNIIANCIRSCSEEENECFEILYGLAKDEVSERQQANNEDNFNLENAIKDELKNFLPKIRFHRMSVKFLMNFVVEKGFTFSFLDVYRNLVSSNSYISEQAAFKSVYKLAEKQALIEQSALPDPSFNLINIVRNKLSGVFLIIKMQHKEYDFVLDFIVEKGFCLSPLELRDYAKNACFSFRWTEEKTFEAIYELAKKQVLMKQKLSNNVYFNDFNLNEAVKNELAEFLAGYNFSKLSYYFIMEFIVPKEIISEEEVCHIFEVQINIKCNDKEINGTFEDIFGILNASAFLMQTYSSETWNKLQCSDLKVQIPTASSTVIKKEGIEWYLCFESDGFLTVKHHTLIESNDYLIAEMKANSDFAFETEKDVYVLICYKNI